MSDTSNTSKLRNRPGDQPLPRPGRECVQDALIAILQDVASRKQLGIERYGSALQTFNGRDPFQDLWEEQIDSLVYLQQLRMEWGEGMRFRRAIEVLVASGGEELEPGSASAFGYNVALDQVRLAVNPRAGKGATDLEQDTRARLHDALGVDRPKERMTMAEVEAHLYAEVLAPMVEAMEILQDQNRRLMAKFEPEAV